MFFLSNKSHVACLDDGFHDLEYALEHGVVAMHHVLHKQRAITGLGQDLVRSQISMASAGGMNHELSKKKAITQTTSASINSQTSMCEFGARVWRGIT